jgi:hypothetical protein
MPSHPSPFVIDDTSAFDINLENFFTALEAVDSSLVPVLKDRLTKLQNGETDRESVLDALLTAAAENEAL